MSGIYRQLFQEYRLLEILPFQLKLEQLKVLQVKLPSQLLFPVNSLNIFNCPHGDNSLTSSNLKESRWISSWQVAYVRKKEKI